MKQSHKLTYAHRNLLGRSGVKREDIKDYRYRTVDRAGTHFIYREGTPEERLVFVDERGKLQAEV